MPRLPLLTIQTSPQVPSGRIAKRGLMIPCAVDPSGKRNDQDTVRGPCTRHSGSGSRVEGRGCVGDHQNASTNSLRAVETGATTTTCPSPTSLPGQGGCGGSWRVSTPQTEPPSGLEQTQPPRPHRRQQRWHGLAGEPLRPAQHWRQHRSPPPPRRRRPRGQPGASATLPPRSCRGRSPLAASNRSWCARRPCPADGCPRLR